MNVRQPDDPGTERALHPEPPQHWQVIGALSALVIVALTVALIAGRSLQKIDDQGVAIQGIDLKVGTIGDQVAQMRTTLAEIRGGLGLPERHAENTHAVVAGQ